MITNPFYDMPKEIERKYLIKNNDWYNHVYKSERYVQSYLANNKHCSIRIRICGDKANLNIKGMTIGVMRDEYEYPIPVQEALEMTESICIKPYIEKTRHFVNHQDKIWEIDVFERENEGLIVAEVELDSPEEIIQLPTWVGNEVTNEPKYYNVCLIDHPYSKWK